MVSTLNFWNLLNINFKTKKLEFGLIGVVDVLLSAKIQFLIQILTNMCIYILSKFNAQVKHTHTYT